MSPDDPDQEILAVKWYTKEEIYNGKDKWRTRLVGKNFDAYFKGQRCPLSIINIHLNRKTTIFAIKKVNGEFDARIPYEKLKLSTWCWSLSGGVDSSR